MTTPKKGDRLCRKKRRERPLATAVMKMIMQLQASAMQQSPPKMISIILQDSDLFEYNANIVNLMAATLLDDVVGQLNTIGSELSNTFEADYGLA